MFPSVEQLHIIFPDENGMETEKNILTNLKEAKVSHGVSSYGKKTKSLWTDVQGTFSFSEFSGRKVKVFGYTSVHHRGGTSGKQLSPLLETELSCSCSWLPAGCLAKFPRGRWAGRCFWLEATAGSRSPGEKLSCFTLMFSLLPGILTADDAKHHLILKLDEN